MIQEEIYLGIIVILILIVFMLLYCNCKNELNIKSIRNKKNKII